MKSSSLLFCIFTIILATRITYSQSDDSLKTYYLDEITVKSGIILEPKSITSIKFKEIEKSDAATISDLAKYIPSVKLQTNSRGESLFYMRGSGERQLALFFDGVPLNIPWDNRIDLSLIPTEAVGEMTVTKGIPSIVYGANTLAGVININSKEYLPEQRKRKLSVQLGENNFQKYSGYLIDGNENYSYLFSLSFKTSDGYSLPDSYNNPAQNPGDLRINSNSQSFNSFAKFNYKFSNTSDIGISVSYIDSEKGVPPETDVAEPRYWRYPLWQKLTVGVNGSLRLGESKKSIIAYSVSASTFKMEIDQYADITYSVFDDIEKDDDLIVYGRFNFTRLFDEHSLLKLSLSGYTTTHKEKFLETNFEEELSYSQNVFSAGAEYEYLNDNHTIILGASLDGSATPETGDKPSKDPMMDVSINSSFIYSFSNELSSQINFGRKTRFPTLRETFSGALGKFIINPDLKAEVAYTGEASITYQYPRGKADLNMFITYLNDGIVRSIETDETGAKKYKRINEDQIRTFGVELNSSFDFTDDLRSNFNFTYLNSYAKNSTGEYKDTLEYKPTIVAGLNVDYTFLSDLNAIFEANYIGKEFGLQGGNEYFKKLPDYLLLNARLSYKIDLFTNTNLQIFFRVNNILDKLYYTQWSLPEAGRQFWGGVMAEF